MVKLEVYEEIVVKGKGVVAIKVDRGHPEYKGSPNRNIKTRPYVNGYIRLDGPKNRYLCKWEYMLDSKYSYNRALEFAQWHIEIYAS